MPRALGIPATILYVRHRSPRHRYPFVADPRNSRKATCEPFGGSGLVNARFAIDDGPAFWGYHDPDRRWNGWAEPAFSREVAVLIVQWVNGGDDDPFVIVVSCIPVLLSFRSIAHIGIPPRDLDALNWRGMEGARPVRIPIAC